MQEPHKEPHKRCTQCGQLKEPDLFRKYTYSKEKGTGGRYSKCKACEAINARYIRAKNTGDVDELLKITKLYETLETLGWRTPLSATPKPQREDKSDDAIEQILRFHVAQGSIVPNSLEPLQISEVITKPVVIQSDTPSELSHWLDAPFEEWQANDISPEYLQETIYESLKAKYRPQIGVDREKYIPLYDDTYKDALNQVLRRFDEYEEMMSSEDEGDE